MAAAVDAKPNAIIAKSIIFLIILKFLQTAVKAAIYAGECKVYACLVFVIH